MRWLLAAFIPLLFLLTAPALAQDIGVQYESIQNNGIIFANICPDSTLRCVTLEDGVSTKCTTIQKDCACRDEGRCELGDILQVIANVMVFILAISGSIFILIFLYGGILWITSNGRPEKIQNGKLTMVRAIVGLVIIFGSYALVALLIGVLINGQAPGAGDTIEDIIGNGADTIIETSTN